MDLDKIFQDELGKRTILINPNILSEAYVPDHLLFRDKEIEEITRNVARFLKGLSAGNMLIHGPPGTGKTHAIKLVMRSYNRIAMERNIKSRMIYVNTKDKTYYQVLLTLLYEFGVNFPQRGLSTSEAIDALKNYLISTEYSYVFVFDEIDKMRRPVKEIEDPMNALIYRMSRLDEITGRENVVFIVISNRTDILQRLEYFTRSKFIPKIVYFREYNATELAEILRDRVKKAFVPDSVDDGAIEYLAAVTKVSGKDLRWSFRVLKEAGIIARDKVTVDVIKSAIEIVDKDMLSETIEGLDIHPLIVLWAISLLQSKDITPRTGYVYNVYKLVCKNLGEEPRSMRHVMHYIVPKLETQGLITSSEKSFGRGKGIALVFHVEEDPTAILKIVEDVLFRKTSIRIDHTDSTYIKFALN